jgi:hypothetical protein
MAPWQEAVAVQDFGPAYDRYGSDSVIRRCPLNVRITPASGPPHVITAGLKSAISRHMRRSKLQLFDHLTGGGLQRQRDRQTKRLGGLEVDD